MPLLPTSSPSISLSTPNSVLYTVSSANLLIGTQRCSLHRLLRQFFNRLLPLSFLASSRPYQSDCQVLSTSHICLVISFLCVNSFFMKTPSLLSTVFSARFSLLGLTDTTFSYHRPHYFLHRWSFIQKSQFTLIRLLTRSLFQF